MKIFYISPWPYSSALTLSTVFPNIRILLSIENVESITVFAPKDTNLNENFGTFVNSRWNFDSRLSLRELPSRPARISPWTRLRDHILSKRIISLAAQQASPQIVICRGTASIYGHHLKLAHGIPYVVESFEPHANYMKQTGTWRWYGLKYLVQLLWESKVKRNAAALVTVSRSYAAYLHHFEGIEKHRLFCVPCWVDPESFKFDITERLRIRCKLGAENRVIALYAGKFEGIYNRVEVLRSLASLRAIWGDLLYVIILTDYSIDAVKNQLSCAGFSPQDMFVDQVSHDDVNGFLCAADFALSFIKSGPWSFACSAIKHGEYWATGLPILMPRGIGDERRWLARRSAGVFVDFDDTKSVTEAGLEIADLLNDPEIRTKVRALALSKRSNQKLQSVYRSILLGVLSKFKTGQHG